MLEVVLTLAVGVVCGFLFLKLKVPGGLMVGSMVGVAIFSIGTGMAVIPTEGRVAAQITAGAFVACTIERSDIRNLRKLAKPLSVLLLGMFILNIVAGFLIHAVSDLDWMTAFFCAVPGGMSDVPIIAADMGANGPMVAVMQFARMVVGVGIFPTLALKLTKNETMRAGDGTVRSAPAPKGTSAFLLTMAVAFAFGILGRVLGVPAGSLLFSLVGVLIFKLLTERAWMPLWMKRLAQLLSGAYIGSSMTYQDLLSLGGLLLPLVIILVGYTLNFFVLGSLIHKVGGGMTRRESYLTATPAGASDMALISSDLDINSPDLIVLQLMRMLIVVMVFPQIIYAIVQLLI